MEVCVVRRAVLLCVGLMYCSIKEITPGNPRQAIPLAISVWQTCDCNVFLRRQ